MTRPLPRSTLPTLVSSRSTASSARGILAASAAFLIWGSFPLYWKLLHNVAADELVAHRVIWSLLLVVPLVLATGSRSELRAALRNRRILLRHALSGLLLAGNWAVYVWAVNAGHIVDASLGYFLVPLFNATVGVLILRERLQRGQGVALALAAAGVGVQVFGFGQVPWIALTLAGTWGTYSLLRKQSPLESLGGLAVETLVLAPAALLWLGWLEANGRAAFGNVDTATHLLIVGTGLVTTAPLLFFAYGARQVDFVTLGMLQYIVPSVQFAIGVAVFHEPFRSDRWLAFGMIWLAVALYTAGGLRALPRRAVP